MVSFRKYVAVFTLGMQSAMEYRADFFISLFGRCFTVIIQFFVWTAVYGSSGNELYGYTYSQMVVYIIMAGVLSQITTTGFEWDIAFDIKNGTFSRFLVQPIGYLPYRVMDFFGYKIIHLIGVNIISISILALLNIGIGAQFSPLYLALAILVIPLSLMINCLLFYCFSALTFWMTEAIGIFIGLRVASNILSGGIFPLDIFGSGAQIFFGLLPFQYVIYFPLNIICGRLSSSEIINGVVAQTIWILILYVISKITWKLGMKKYIAAGG
jgi:ABC-2 type transport system permease protein